MYALVEPCAEALEQLVGIERLPQFLVIVREVCGQYSGVVAINMDHEDQHSFLRGERYLSLKFASICLRRVASIL